ncbi:MAG: purine-nucleoside phosphorylase [Gemmatimonadota bacterium]
MSPDSTLAILRVASGDLAPVAIVVGDPDRARAAAALLDDSVEIGSNREYVTLAGSRDGVRLVVASHGVGASGANVCFAELFRGGVRTVVRAGTCGGIVEGIDDGDVLVVGAAVREDGASDQLISPGYPAVAHRDVVEALVRSSDRRGVAYREGLVVTEATFYPGAFAPRWQAYTDYGALAVEMEMSSLFVVASMHGVRAGGILVVDGNLVETRNPDMSDYDPNRQVVREAVDRMLEIAVDAAVNLAGGGS